MPDNPQPLFNAETMIVTLMDLMPAVFKHALRLTGNRADADDLAQESFLSALESLDQVSRSKGIHGYLMRIVRNLHIDRQRKETVRKRHVAAEKELAAIALKKQAGTREESFDMRHMIARSEVERLMELFREEELSEGLWQFVLAGNAAGWDYAKIAVSMGCDSHKVRHEMTRLKNWVMAKQPDGMGRCALACALVVMAWRSSHPECM